MASGARSGKFADLSLRAGVAAAFATVAYAAIWFGGLAALFFAMAAGGVTVWEWRRISRGPAAGPLAPTTAGWQITAVVGAAVIAHYADILTAALFLVAVAFAGVVADRLLSRRPWWSLLGAIYIGLALSFFVILRDDPAQGFKTIVWLLLVVVATDVGAYFVGRAIGGPKLWVRVSPGKTWSGAIGGVALAVFAAFMFATGAEISFGMGTVAVTIAISVVSQCGDLAESAYKRRFGVKDSGRILPGHGGLLDRLDGLIAATLLVGAFALLRPETPVWAW